MDNKRTDHEEQDRILVEDPVYIEQPEVPEKKAINPGDAFFEFLTGEWKEYLETYRYYYSQLLAEAEKPERSALAHDPALCRLPDGTVTERYVNGDEEAFEDGDGDEPNPLVLPDLFECMNEFPPGTEFSWQNVKADWGWNTTKVSDYDQVKQAGQMLAELEKMEKLRLHLLGQRNEVELWLESYSARKLAAEPVNAETNTIDDWKGWRAWLTQKGEVMSEYTGALLERFAVTEPVVAYSGEFSQKIFETIQRRD